MLISKFYKTTIKSKECYNYIYCSIISTELSTEILSFSDTIQFKITNLQPNPFYDKPIMQRGREIMIEFKPWYKRKTMNILKQFNDYMNSKNDKVYSTTKDIITRHYIQIYGM